MTSPAGPDYPSLFFYGVSDTDFIAGINGGNGYYLIESGPKVVPLPNYPGAQATSYCCMDTATGTMAGNYIPAGAPLTTLSGFFYQNGKFTSLPWSDASGSPSYEYTIAALNNAGIVVGTYQCNYVLGFVYAKGKMTLLAHPGSNRYQLRVRRRWPAPVNFQPLPAFFARALQIRDQAPRVNACAI